MFTISYYSIAIIAVCGLAGAILVYAGVVLYNRREKRRRAAMQVATLLRTKFGLPDEIVGFWDAYAVGDYLGPQSLVRRAVEAAQAFQNTDRVTAIAWTITRHCLDYFRNDPQKIAEIMRILGENKSTTTGT